MLMYARVEVELKAWVNRAKQVNSKWVSSGISLGTAPFSTPGTGGLPSASSVFPRMSNDMSSLPNNSLISLKSKPYIWS